MGKPIAGEDDDCFWLAFFSETDDTPLTHSNTLLFQEYYQLEELEDRETCTTELYLRGDGVVEFGETDGPKYLVAAGTWSVPYGTNDYNSKFPPKKKVPSFFSFFGHGSARIPGNLYVFFALKNSTTDCFSNEKHILFVVVITRIFGAGNDARKGQTGMGEFTFEGKALFFGGMTEEEAYVWSSTMNPRILTPPQWFCSFFRLLSLSHVHVCVYTVTKSYRGDMTMVGESVGVTGIMSTTDTTDNTEREVGYFNMIDATEERNGVSSA